MKDETNELPSNMITLCRAIFGKEDGLTIPKDCIEFQQSLSHEAANAFAALVTKRFSGMITRVENANGEELCSIPARKAYEMAAAYQWSSPADISETDRPLFQSLGKCTVRIHVPQPEIQNALDEALDYLNADRTEAEQAYRIDNNLYLKPAMLTEFMKTWDRHKAPNAERAPTH